MIVLQKLLLLSNTDPGTEPILKNTGPGTCLVQNDNDPGVGNNTNQGTEIILINMIINK